MGRGATGQLRYGVDSTNKYLLWHEAMHLLYAHDCYDENGWSTCLEPRCLMQYIPCESNCEGSCISVKAICIESGLMPENAAPEV